MSFRHVRESYFEPDPEPKSDGALFNAEELREQDLEQLARRLYRALDGCELCPVCRGEAKWAEAEMKRLKVST